MKSTSINNPMNFLRFNPLINISLLCGTSLLYETKQYVNIWYGSQIHDCILCFEI